MFKEISKLQKYCFEVLFFLNVEVLTTVTTISTYSAYRLVPREGVGR